jgi:hypothetical protein
MSDLGMENPIFKTEAGLAYTAEEQARLEKKNGTERSEGLEMQRVGDAGSWTMYVQCQNGIASQISFVSNFLLFVEILPLTRATVASHKQ